MKLIISPAKTLDFKLALDYETKATTKLKSEPKFGKESEELVKKMAKFSEKQIAKLMDISPKLAKLNFDRFQEWPSAPQKQAVLAYMGDVYAGLEAWKFSEQDFKFAQENLRIISGLYGLLRPLDLIKPYRLEMGIKVGPKDSLYDFWEKKLSKELANDLIINLASEEYSKAIKAKNIIDVNFYEMPKNNKNGGKPKIIGLFAKKARGMMARYIIKNQLAKPEGMKKFTDGGYKFEARTSNDRCYNFIR